METIEEVIRLAKACYPKSEQGRVGIDLGDYTFDESYRKSGSYNVLIRKIESLSRDEVAAIDALMWLGRDAEKDTKKDWHRLMEEARQLYDKKDSYYLAENCRLADYLTAGVAKLKKLQSKD